MTSPRSPHAAPAADSPDDGSFLSRWSRRKAAVREGRPVAPEPPAPAGPAPVPRAAQPEAAQPEAPPAPTLADVALLKPGEGISRFVARGVDEQVKRAALKTLFADPHFNVMDGLDTYIDDYSIPDPMPPEMLRNLASAKFLKLFEEEEKKEEEEAKAPTLREGADDPRTGSVAQSSSRPEQALPPAEDHADPDLRLQQDDAPGPEGPGAGAR